MRAKEKLNLKKSPVIFKQTTIGGKEQIPMRFKFENKLNSTGTT
jgi:hypothetical protein